MDALRKGARVIIRRASSAHLDEDSRRRKTCASVSATARRHGYESSKESSLAVTAPPLGQESLAPKRTRRDRRASTQLSQQKKTRGRQTIVAPRLEAPVAAVESLPAAFDLGFNKTELRAIFGTARQHYTHAKQLAAPGPTIADCFKMALWAILLGSRQMVQMRHTIEVWLEALEKGKARREKEEARRSQEELEQLRVHAAEVRLRSEEEAAKRASVETFFAKLRKELPKEEEDGDVRLGTGVLDRIHDGELVTQLLGIGQSLSDAEQCFQELRARLLARREGLLDLHNSIDQSVAKADHCVQVVEELMAQLKQTVATVQKEEFLEAAAEMCREQEEAASSGPGDCRMLSRRKSRSRTLPADNEELENLQTRAESTFGLCRQPLILLRQAAEELQALSDETRGPELPFLRRLSLAIESCQASDTVNSQDAVPRRLGSGLLEQCQPSGPNSPASQGIPFVRISLESPAHSGVDFASRCSSRVLPSSPRGGLPEGSSLSSDLEGVDCIELEDEQGQAGEVRSNRSPHSPQSACPPLQTPDQPPGLGSLSRASRSPVFEGWAPLETPRDTPSNPSGRPTSDTPPRLRLPPTPELFCELLNPGSIESICEARRKLARGERSQWLTLPPPALPELPPEPHKPVRPFGGPALLPAAELRQQRPAAAGSPQRARQAPKAKDRAVAEKARTCLPPPALQRRLVVVAEMPRQQLRHRVSAARRAHQVCCSPAA